MNELTLFIIHNPQFITRSLTFHLPTFHLLCKMLLKGNRLILVIVFLAFVEFVTAQTIQSTKTLATQYSNGVDPNAQQYDSQGRPLPKKAKGGDSLQHRDKFADSITIYYRYYDSTRTRSIDSSVNDFYSRFHVPFTNNSISNLGSASKSLLFSPWLKSGWDAGFHQFDTYKFTVENTKFYQTTRPYTELGYLLGSKAEQLINFIHTQNKKSKFNFSLEYRFSNAPGLYRLQNASHNNIRVTTHYQSDNKKYESFFVLISNKHVVSENGGLDSVAKLQNLALGDPYEVPTRLGFATQASRNPFNTTVNTGNTYKETVLLYRHQYDFGKRDSLVTDSVTYQLFYPRFRIQHTLQISSNEYVYKDIFAVDSLYNKYFNYKLPPPYALGLADTVSFKDKWSNIKNEFALITFPDKNNQAQYAKAGIGLQNLTFTGNDSAIKKNYYNLYLLGEYRNRSRNNVYDIEATGQLYLSGLNAGDYAAYISLKRQLSKKIGTLQLGFQNTNRTPSFIYDALTRFPVISHQPFKKENITHLFGVYENPKLAFKLTGDYYLVNNYAYSDSFFTVNQDATLFNVLHIGAEKMFKLSKHLNWYSEVHIQQVTGGAPVNVPFLLTRNRIAFEGNFYTNLFLSTGIEFRYYTNYKADNYSPFTGQFFNQNTFTTSNRPDINLFFNFRIKSFKAFVRVENLNTINTSTGSFDKYSFNAQQYPGTGLTTRLGIWWNFIN